MWAIGVLAYYIIDNISPFVDTTDEGTKENIIKHNVSFDSDEWHNISSHCKEFIKKCLNKDPHQRPTIDDLLDDPFIKSASH